MRLLILHTQEPTLNDHLAKAVAEGFAAVLGKDNVHVTQYDNACAQFATSVVKYTPSSVAT